MAAARHRAEIVDTTEPGSPLPDRPHWEDPAASRTGQLVWQFIGVWLLGGCTPFVLDGVAHGYELGGTEYTVATTGMLVVVALGLIALLYLLVRATALVTPLGASRRGRLLWAVLVAAVGTLAWLAGRAVATAREPGVLHNGRMAVLLGGGLAVLVAALLTRGWWLRAPAAAALIVLAGAGVFAFRDLGPSDLDVRLDQAARKRTDFNVVTVAGYHPAQLTFGTNETGDEYVPDTPGAGGRIVLRIVDISHGCQPPRCLDPGYLYLGVAPTIFEDRPPRAAVLHHQRIYELTGDPGVDPQLLLHSLTDIRQARDAEIAQGLPPFSPRNPVEAARHWLREHT
ncbi:hypothetical protein [Actinoplanes sp. NPDC020271]|uniref:hypothetical protein n=1 Tax=Actinoplanes sp. NPDC020271 TaxID=3363896 RepID=UPI0037AA2661